MRVCQLAFAHPPLFESKGMRRRQRIRPLKTSKADQPSRTPARFGGWGNRLILKPAKSFTRPMDIMVVVASFAVVSADDEHAIARRPEYRLNSLVFDLHGAVVSINCDVSHNPSSPRTCAVDLGDVVAAYSKKRCAISARAGPSSSSHSKRASIL